MLQQCISFLSWSFSSLENPLLDVSAYFCNFHIFLVSCNLWHLLGFPSFNLAYNTICYFFQLEIYGWSFAACWNFLSSRDFVLQLFNFSLASAGSVFGVFQPPIIQTTLATCFCASIVFKLTWLVLGGDPAARSHRVEQFTALWGL